MASSAPLPAATIAPFSLAVVNAMRTLYPEKLADKSFDNTGLLLEAPFDPARRQRNSVLLTVDLTKAVADEAIRRRDSIVVTYHPIIFRGLKSITLADSQQQSLLRLAAAGISVYSPHTAVDCAAGGLGDWLADIITGTPSGTASPSSAATSSSSGFTLHHHPSASPAALALGAEAHDRAPITPVSFPEHPGAGMGRIIRFHSPVPLATLLQRISLGLGVSPAGFPIATPQLSRLEDISIRSLALCPGSGGGLFPEIEKSGQDSVDAYFTGELSHHEALAAIEKGKTVVTLFHSNSERGFLRAVLRGQLETQVAAEWKKVRAEGGKGDEACADESVEVAVSEADRDPYGIMVPSA